MADGITLNSMAGGSLAETDDIGGKHYQRIKLIHGADGVNDGDVSAANPFPVKGSGDVAHDSGDSGNPLKVGGKAGVSALPTAVSNNDRANLLLDRYGRPIVAGMDPGLFTWKKKSFTTSQTGAALWTPASGKRIALTNLIIGIGGTTAARVTIWFGASGDTTFSDETDQDVFDGTLTPTATSTPPVIITPADPIYCLNTDFVLRVTTDAGITIRIIANGFEFTP